MNYAKLYAGLALVCMVAALSAWRQGLDSAVFVIALIAGYLGTSFGARLLLQNKKNQTLRALLFVFTATGIEALWQLNQTAPANPFSSFGIWGFALLCLGFGAFTGIWAAPAWELLSRRRK